MYKRTWKARLAAWLLCFGMLFTSVPIDSFASDVTTEEIINTTEGNTDVSSSDTKNPSVEKTEGTDSSDSGTVKGTETTADTGNNADKNTGESGDSQNGNEVVSNDTTQGNGTEGSRKNEQKYMDAKFSVVWSDEQNIAKRREADIHKLIEIYANGTLVDDSQYEITQTNEEPEQSYGLDTYHYVIENLPVYQDDMQTKIQYTLRECTDAEANVIKGYTEMTKAAFDDGISEEEISSSLEDMAAPDEEVVLEEKDENYQGKKSFGNYLPAYQVSGSITWTGNDTSVYPEMEQYFKEQFTIERGGSTYNYHEITYTQDEEDKHIWHYEVAGLFSVDEDGAAATYKMTFGLPEGWSTESTVIDVSEDTDEADVVFEAGEAQVKAVRRSFAVSRAVTTAINTAEGASGSASFQVKWITNVLPDPLPFIASEIYYTLTSVEEGTVPVRLKLADVKEDGKIILTDDAVTALGLTQDAVNSITVTRSGIGTGMEKYAVTGFPDTLYNTTTDEEGQEVKTIVGTLTYDFWQNYNTDDVFTWKINGDDYLIRKSEEGIDVIPLIDFTANVNVRNGGGEQLKPLEVVSAFTLKSNGRTYTFCEDGTLSYVDSDNVTKKLEYAAWSIDGDNNLQITNLPEYTMDKTLIDWKVEVNAEEYSNIKLGEDAADYYEVSYNNSNVPNYGSDRTVCHNNGTIFLSIKGITDYEATKVWLDDYTDTDDNEKYKEEHRPDVKWELWRYSAVEGANWKSASPVYNSAGDQITWVIDETKDTQNVKQTNLPKYDTDGYEYIYFAREIIVTEKDNYEQVFGEVSRNEEGEVTVTDTLPDQGSTRQDNDNSVYGGGTLSNRRQETVSKTQTKTWEAAAHQNELGNVYVELQLQVSSDGGENWKDVDDQVQYLAGFTAEQLAKTISVFVEQYDEFGKICEYRWVETGVYEGNPEETDNPINLYNEETGRVTLSHNQFSVNEPGEEWYESETEGDTIVNRLQGTTNYIVKKEWAGGLTPDEEEKAEITWTLLQNGEVYVDKEGKEYSNMSMTNADADWQQIITGLPKYDDSGLEYEYIAIETACNLEGWALSGYEYNVPLENEKGGTQTKNTCKMTNVRIGTSAGKVINVRKEWIDDGDTSCREEVEVQVWREAFEKDGVEYDKKLVGTVVLDKDHDWWKQVNVSEYVTDENGEYVTDENGARILLDDEAMKYTLREVRLGTQKKVGEGDQTKYYGTPCDSMDLQNQAADGHYIGNENHIYYIEYSEGKDEATGRYFYTVSNRRVGVVNIAVTKTWIDGYKYGDGTNGGMSAEEREALEAKLTLECVEHPEAVSGNTVCLEGDLPETCHKITDNSGEEVNSVQQLGKSENLKEDENGNGVETVYFYNLPKYDKDGKVVHYTVIESSRETTTTDGEESDALTDNNYATSLAESYVTGEQHTQDMQSVAITNKREATKTVRFYKEWYDQYRFNRNQRPDIYLNLYQKSLSDGLEVTDYRNILWTKTGLQIEGDDSENSTGNNSGDYNWTCSFPELPMYNSHGEEIYYYASENMLVDRYVLEYLYTEYEWGGKTYSNTTYDSDSGKYVSTPLPDAEKEILLDSKQMEGYEDKSQEYLLREEGTFVNRIQNVVHINGTKIWKNIPGSFDKDHLPTLKIKVWRAYADEVEADQDHKYYDASSGNPITEGGAWGDPVAYISELKSTSLNTTFKLDYEGENDASGNPVGEPTDEREHLKQFDENGRRYVYVITEEILGYDNEEVKQIEGAYQDPSGINGYQITNVYNPEPLGEVSITKEWDFPENYTESDGTIHYPEIKFTLYWRYQYRDESGKLQYSPIQKVDAENAVSEKTLRYDENNTTVTFDKLPMKAPNGSTYEYYVAESFVNGYDQKVKVEEGKDDKTASAEVTDEIKLIQPDAAAVSGSLYAVENSTVNNTVREGIETVSTLADEGEPAEGESVSPDRGETIFLNTYIQQKPFSLTGTKTWNDYNNKLNTRPENLTIEVWRRNSAYEKEELFEATGNQENVSPLKPNTNDITVSWTKVKDSDGKDTNQWTYTITGLDQYAPNGELWQYKVVEKVSDDKGNSLIDPYDAKKTETRYVTAPTVVDEDGNLKTVVLSGDDSFVNELYTSHSVQKQWENINPEIAKLNVDMKLQVRVDDGTAWTDASDYFSGDKDIGYAIDGDDAPWSETLTIGSSYSYTWYNLPKGEMVNGTFKAYEYRVIETKVGNEDVTFDAENQTYNDTTIFTITYSTGDGTTTVTNKLKDDEKTSLKVAKVWDDKDNQFDLRPTDGSNWSVTFEIWRKSEDDEPIKEAVYKEDGTTQLTVTVSANENESFVEIKDLPICTKNAEGGFTQWTYYAKEVLTGALNDGYEQTVVDAPYDATNKVFTSTTTNTLITTDISGTKSWDDDDSSFRPDSISLTLQISVNQNGTWSDWSNASTRPGYDEVSPTWDKSTDSDNWQWKYTGLPVTDKDGNAVKYRVVEQRQDGYYDPVYSNVTPENGTSETDTPNYLDQNTITNYATRFTLDKVGEEDPDHKINTKLTFEGQTGTAVAGWKLEWERRADGTESYTIYDKNGTSWKTGNNITDTTKSVEIVGLPVGTYKLTGESPLPYGYETVANKGYTITVPAKNTDSMSGSGNNIEISGNTVTVKDTRQELKIRKEDLGGSTLTGAVFGITGQFRQDDTTLTVSNTKRVIGDDSRIPSESAFAGANVLAAGELVAGQEYTLQELYAPDGYICSDIKVTFKMDESGNVTILNESGGNTATAGGDTITFKDQPIEITMEKADALTGGNLLGGAEFTLKDITSEDTQPQKTVTIPSAGANKGKLVLKGTDAPVPLIQGHTYTLTETKGADGYKLIENLSLTFTVETDGTVTFASGTNNDYFKLDDAKTSIRIKNDPVQVKIIKVGAEEGNPRLADAEFTLMKGLTLETATTVATGLKTGENGELLLKTSETGDGHYTLSANADYILVETTAPAGYELVRPLTFHIDACGSVTSLTYLDGSNVEGVAVFDTDNNTKDSTLTVKDEKTAFALDKLSKDSGVSDNTVPMKGVTLAIYSGDNKILTWSRANDANGTVTVSVESGYTYKDRIVFEDNQIKGLPSGDYILKEESAPAGYLTIPDYSFTLDTDGTLKPASGQGSSTYVTISDDKLTMTAVDERIRGDVELTKCLGSVGTNNKLSGVTFDLYQQAGAAPADGDTKIAENLVTDANGKLSLANQAADKAFLAGEDQGQSVSIGLPIGKYYFKETGATADSVLSSDPITFEITANRDTTIQPEPIELNPVNEVFAADVVFTKEDSADGTELDRVVFKLKYTPDSPAGHASAYDGDNAHTYTTGSDGKITLTGLTKGSYELYEVTAEGYYVGDGNGFRATFRITENDSGKTGENALKLSETTGFTVTSTGRATYDESTNTVKNVRIPGSVAILKEDDAEGNADLNGAQFTLKKTKEANGNDVNIEWNFTFETGKVYKVSGETFEEDTEAAAQTGVLKITGLDWGEYTLTETKAPDGYVLPEVNPTVPFTIFRYARDYEAITDGYGVRNVRNSVTLQKRAKVAEGTETVLLLPGAVYTLTPADGCKFADGTTDSKTYTMPDGTNGTVAGELTLSAELVGGDTYTLTEIQAPYGYELPAEDERSVTFTITTDGVIKINGETQDLNCVYISDEKISVSLDKADMSGTAITGDALNGTTFTISGQFAQPNGTAGTAETKTVTASSGTLDLSSLDGLWIASTGTTEGTDLFTYTLTETKAPDGYELPITENRSITFTISTDGTVNMTDNSVFSSSNDKITVKDQTIEIDIVKKDAEGNIIGDEERGYAEFKVEGTFAGGSTDPITGTTEEISSKLEGKLIASYDGGTEYVYTLTETKAPDGYILTNPAPTVQFTVNETGHIIFKNADTNAFITDGTITLTNEYSDSISVKNLPVTVDITKKDISVDAGDPITGELRGEAYFNVTPAEGKTFADGSTEAIEIHTGENGTAALTGKLRPGVEYIMTETKAPDGYELAAAFTFTVNEQGNVTIKGSDAPAEADSHSVTIKDRKIEAGLVKISTDDDSDTPSGLEGAVFTVAPDQGSRFVSVEGTDDNLPVITIDDEHQTALDGELIAGHTYLLQEIKAPDGYELLRETIRFTVEDDGTIRLDETQNASVDEENNRIIITVKDKPLELSFIKRFTDDRTAVGAVGATLMVRGRFADRTDTEIIWTTEAEAKVFKSVFIAGETYTLRELKAPDGALFMEDRIEEDFTWTFKVDEDGNVIDISSNLTYDEDAETVTVWNEPATLTLYKKDMDRIGSSDDPLLAGCTFEITGTFAPDRYGETEDTETIRVTTTGKDTIENALKGRLIVGNTYKIKEVQAVDGYELGTETTFTVTGTRRKDDGTMALVIELNDETGAQGDHGFWTTEDNDGNPVILMRDKPLEFAIKKTDAKGKALAGVEFSIIGVFADGTKGTKTFTTDKDGYIQLDRQLIESNPLTRQEYIYRLTEVKTAKGYEKLKYPIFFKLVSITVDADGNPVAEGSEKAVARKSQVEILYGDRYTPVSYEKQLSRKDSTDSREVLTVVNHKITTIKTGDTTQIATWLVLMGIAVAALVALLIKRQR